MQDGRGCHNRAIVGKYCLQHHRPLARGYLWPLKCKGGDHGRGKGGWDGRRDLSTLFRRCPELSEYCRDCAVKKACPYCFERNLPSYAPQGAERYFSEGSNVESVGDDARTAAVAALNAGHYGTAAAAEYHGWGIYDDSGKNYFGKGRHDECRRRRHYDTDDEEEAFALKHGGPGTHLDADLSGRADRIVDRRRRKQRREQRLAAVKIQAMQRGERARDYLKDVKGLEPGGEGYLKAKSHFEARAVEDGDDEEGGGGGNN